MDPHESGILGGRPKKRVHEERAAASGWDFIKNRAQKWDGLDLILPKIALKSCCMDYDFMEYGSLVHFRAILQ